MLKLVELLIVCFLLKVQGLKYRWSSTFDPCCTWARSA
jgi:hypothetical protein